MPRSSMLATTAVCAVVTAICVSTTTLTLAQSPSAGPAEAVTANRPSDDGGIAGGTANGPDVIVSSLASTVSEYGVIGGVSTYAFTTVSCNLGEADAEWFANTNRHPVIAQNIYRLKDGRFEQIGISWLKHGWCAADASGCGSPYEPNGSCDWLGTHATDTYGASLNADQADLGPRSEVNPWTGAYPYPYVLNWNLTGACTFKRCQVLTADLDPALNAGASYIAEAQYVCTDEQPVNRYNNVSYRGLTVGTLVTSLCNSSSQYNLTASGSVSTQQAAINAWRAVDPSVVLTNIDVPNDGRLIIGSKVTNLGGGQWQYEYALYNMNCDRSVRSFGIPFESSVGIANIGFHDISYHSGEPYSSVDWATSVGVSGTMSWETQTFAQNPNANALRWGTLYNFRFTAAAPPRCTTATIGLFKPGTPDSVTVTVPGPAACIADIAPVGLGNATVDVDDLLEVINRWGSCTLDTSVCGCPADISPIGGNDAVNVDDLLGVINAWGGCP